MHFTICIYIAIKSAGKRRKWYFQGSRFLNFQGGTCLLTPLEAHAFGARCYVRTLQKKHATPLKPKGL